MSITVSAHSVRAISAIAKSYEGYSWVDVSVHQDGVSTIAFVAHFEARGEEAKALANAYAAAINGVDASPVHVPAICVEAA